MAHDCDFGITSGAFGDIFVPTAGRFGVNCGHFKYMNAILGYFEIAWGSI